MALASLALPKMKRPIANIVAMPNELRIACFTVCSPLVLQSDVSRPVSVTSQSSFRRIPQIQAFDQKNYPFWSTDMPWEGAPGSRTSKVPIESDVTPPEHRNPNRSADAPRVCVDVGVTASTVGPAALTREAVWLSC